ncbi:hypothetical protein Lfu02_55900 [Longispora fulva]|uniref:ABC-type phosphate transport system substrate-binding protein n=1 Tax=Longispora fulva TaxID=619741 RepID=A0A8J7KQI0_9ACTN|nr:hypothetical protein [Longispora fulva]MBG6137427.1 ABC-type phosphate transport system substrate-binding protein [Longispora fulva]GIG61218.1 hypothetical protein Lfu02_55900 [Longispora fulva]
MKIIGRVLGVSLGAAALALAVVASPAAAEPNPVGDYRQLAGVGSDTTQDALNGLGEVVKDGSNNKVIASYDARPLNTNIKTKAANCDFKRPDGSGNGRTALRASNGEAGGLYQGANVVGCVDFARSSSYGGGTPGEAGAYTYISFGVDSVTYAVNANSDLPSSLTYVQLQRIYRCLTTNVGGTPVTPLLVQSGSGTRSFWLSKMGVTEADIAAGDYPCLQTLNNTIQEHDGRVLDNHNDYLMPFSTGQFIAQGNAANILTQTGVTVADRRGSAVLGRVNNLAPVTNGVLNVNFRTELVRDVYDVVPTTKLTDPVIAATFVGSTSYVCAAKPTIELFGFGYRSTFADLLHQGCGDTRLKANS